MRLNSPQCSDHLCCCATQQTFVTGTRPLQAVQTAAYCNAEPEKEQEKPRKIKFAKIYDIHEESRDYESKFDLSKPHVTYMTNSV